MLARLFFVALAALALGCDPDPVPMDGGPDAGDPNGPATPRVSYALEGDVYDAPWPDERLRGPDGRVSMADFPNGRRVRIVTQLVDMLEGAAGFGRTSTMFVAFDRAIDVDSLPSGPTESLAADASVYVLDVDPDSATRGERHPITTGYTPDDGLFGPAHLLGVLPLQGRPLAPNRLYALVVTTRLRGADGTAVLRAPATVEALSGTAPDGMNAATLAAHTNAAETLEATEREQVAAMAVFRTWDPLEGLTAAVASLRSDDAPTPSATTAEEVFDDFCVFHATVEMPDFQEGEAPYLSNGGGWARDGAGALVRQRQALSNVWITLPRGAMPDEGFPTAVFVRTGGGGDRPLVDRGPRAEAGGEAIAEGTGPALHLSRAGLAGVSIDGPLGGLRNLEGWDEQFAIFNINNPIALRDSVRQSALELTLIPRILDSLTIDASSCPDLSTTAGDSIARLDTAQLALMGHSMGATIAPLAAALEPRYSALVLSGAGASWLENVVFKENPIRVRPTAEGILMYGGRQTLHEHDPTLALLQWAGESSDTQVYAPHLIAAPLTGSARHVLMFQGILDTYIPPPIANPLTLALEVDLAGGALDETIDRFEPLRPLLPFSGREAIELPSSANAAGGVTGVVVQHMQGPIEDGHEVVFQTEAPQHQYRCFLESWAAGETPRVIDRDATSCE